MRLDSRFASPAIFAELEHAGADYVVGMAGNAVLDRLAAPHLATLRTQVAITGETATSYHEAMYQAGSWTHARRVIIKAEVVAYPGREPRDNPCFVTTNLRHRPATVYADIYCAPRRQREPHPWGTRMISLPGPPCNPRPSPAEPSRETSRLMPTHMEETTCDT